jgi:dTDP-4-dehydrorhamnose reductase
VRWLVTGAGGMLGHDAVTLLSGRGEQVTATSRDALDITDAVAVADLVSGHDVVLNCAGWTEVDDAEKHEAAAFRANAIGPAVLARAVAATGVRLVHLSTDYVFDGMATAPYRSDDPLRPRSAYGRSKAAGEWAVRAELREAHLIVRTAWLYGARGRCFPKSIATAASTNGAIRVVGDQVGQPTWTRDVADFVHRLVLADAPPGTYHATSSGQASWFEFAQEVCKAAGLGRDAVSRTTSTAYPRPAPRPAYSVLGHETGESAGITAIGDWRERWRIAAASVLGLPERSGVWQQAE